MFKEVRVSKIAKFLNSEFYGVDNIIKGGASLDNAKDNMVIFSKKNSQEIVINKKVLLLASLDYKCDNIDYTVIKVKNPRLAFAKVLNKFFIEKPLYEIHKTAIIGKNFNANEAVAIGANCYIGDNVTIGKNTVINNNVVIFNNTNIGNSCYIKSGAIIGEEGLGFDFEDDGTPVRIPHIGNVEIGSDVEIGSNTVISRGTLGSTIIQNDVKIDDQVFIAHNCSIGQKTIIVAFAEISGSVVIGKNCWIGPNSSIIQKIEIGDYVTVGIGAVVTKNIESKKKVMGFEALELRNLLKLKKRIEYGK